MKIPQYRFEHFPSTDDGTWSRIADPLKPRNSNVVGTIKREALPSTDGGTAIYIIPVGARPMSAALPDPAEVLDAYLREAIAEIKVAYGFVPNSYTYRAMQACLAAAQAFAALREALETESGA